MAKNKRQSESMRGITEESRFHSEFIKLTKRVRENIRRLRLERGLTQEQMQDFEINLRQFQRIESGETQNITLASLFKIAKALSKPIDEIIN